MESSNQLPFDATDQQASRLLCFAMRVEQRHLQNLRLDGASVAGINPKNPELLRMFHEEMQSRFDLSPPHARYEALLHGCSSGCGTPTLSVHVKHDVLVSTQKPILRGWGLQVLQKQLPSLFAYKPHLAATLYPRPNNTGGCKYIKRNLAANVTFRKWHVADGRHLNPIIGEYINITYLT